MATLDKRSTMFDDGQPRQENAIVASSTTSVVERTDGVKEIPVNVPPGSASLMVAVTGLESEPAKSPPRGIVEVRLQDEDGQQATPLAPASEYGRVLFVVDDPRPGRWRVFVQHAKESAFVVRAVAMRDRALEYVREKWPSIRCAGCKEGVHAAVAIAVGMLAGALAGAATASAAAVAYIAGKTRLPEHIINYLLERMSDSTLDQLIDEACVLMQMCVRE